ncbi:putative ribonuclease H protein [Senna tora]|uniref:Putative ribonuclease H protein n=1 Tax=Senna tora TaxID=362788 RepID=A0A835C2L2_9FABA|nr:putative ribonuclease H protein [Senna tora]
MWVADPKGVFSMKCCYRTLIRETWSAIELLQDTCVYPDSAFWKQLWKLPILPRYKNFMWRALLDILPTYAALCRRGVHVVDNGCIFCGNEVEDAFHYLVECSLLQVIWGSSMYDFSSSKFHNSSSYQKN